MFVKKKLAMNNPKDKDETRGGKQGSDLQNILIFYYYLVFKYGMV